MKLPNPTLDPARRGEILDEVLASEPTPRSHRPWLLPAAAAAAVGVIAGGLALADHDDAPPPDRGTVATGTPHPQDRVVDFTTGPLSAADARRLRDDCLATFSESSTGFATVYARRTRTAWGRGGVVVIRQAGTGTELLCSDDGQSRIAGPDSKSVVVEPTVARPITVADGGGTGSSSRDGRILTLATSTAYRVAGNVARIEMRVGTAADPGTWYRSTPENGFAYVSARLDHAVPEDAALFVEARAFDADGHPLTSAPMGRSRLETRLSLRRP